MMLKDDIIRDLQGGSFPLEIKCSSILIKHGWNVFNQVSYIDPQTQEVRVINILAKRSKWDEQRSEAVNTNLIIECKKSNDKPWVFYAQKIPKHPLNYWTYEGELLTSHYANRKSPKKPMFHLGNHRVGDMQRGLIPVEAFKNGCSKNIFTASNESAKDAYYFFVSEDNYFRQQKKVNGILTVYPIIVIEGKLFSASASKTDELDIEEEDWIMYDFPLSFVPEKLANPVTRIYIDVVRIDSFEKLLLLLDDELDETSISEMWVYEDQDMARALVEFLAL